MRRGRSGQIVCGCGWLSDKGSPGLKLGEGAVTGGTQVHVVLAG